MAQAASTHIERIRRIRARLDRIVLCIQTAPLGLHCQGHCQAYRLNTGANLHRVDRMTLCRPGLHHRIVRGYREGERLEGIA